MKKIFIYIIFFFYLAPNAKAQYGFNDMVELTGVIMSSDSLRYLPLAAVRVKGTDIGTLSNTKGVFTIIAPKGSTLEFSSLGFKKENFKIPDTLRVNRYSLIQLMVQDTFYLPTTIIRPLMTREEFERAFVKWDIPPDQFMASSNTEFYKHGRRKITTQQTYHDDVLKQPELEILSAKLIHFQKEYIIIGEVQNIDNSPADVIIKSTLYNHKDKPLASFNAKYVIKHKLMPKEITNFKINFEEIA